MTTAHLDDNGIQKVSLEEQEFECNKLQHEIQPVLTPIFRINPEESVARNRKFLKDLELTKARLRTYAAYTPTDQELQHHAAAYRKHLPKYIQNFSRFQRNERSMVFQSDNSSRTNKL